MRAVPIISLIARVALMVAMVLGLLFWADQISWVSFLVGRGILIIRNIHILLGLTGALSFLVLGTVAVVTRGIRLWGVGSILYSLILPAFGLMQTSILVGHLHWLTRTAHLLVGVGAMYLALEVEKRYDRLGLSGDGAARPETKGMPKVPGYRL